MPEEQNSPPLAEEPVEPKPNEPEKEEEVSLLPKNADGGSKEFHTSNKGNIGISTAGDQTTIHAYYGPVFQGLDDPQLRQHLEEIMKKRPGEFEKDDSPDASSNRKKVPGHRIKFEQKIDEDISFHEDGDDSSTKTVQLPETDAELADWYRNLSPFDKCFVQAMVVFDGASVPEIMYATGKLYEPIQQVVMAAASQQSSSSSRLEAPDDVLLSERLERTHTKKRRISRGTRLFWQDTDASGVSQFKTRVLHFIAEEVHMWTSSVFLDLLEFWAERLTDENGPRAVRALGAIWWHQADRLQGIANRWTMEGSPRWYRAAYLLDGAYEVDRITFGDAADDANKSPVLWLVEKWVKDARFSEAVNRGCAAALTYTLIGEQSPALALRGLDALLELPKPTPKSDREPEGILEEVYEAVVFGYVDLAVDGRLREVLQHLARRLELSSYRRLPLTDMKSYERIHYRVQRQVQAIAALDAFFRITILSFRNVNEDQQWVKYSLDGPLRSSIISRKSDGREILLVGLLAGAWKTQIAIFLCAALIEKLGDFAFVLLRLWADIVLKDQGPSPDKVRKAYVEFLVELEQMIRTWCNHLVDLGFPVSSAPGTFRRKLEKWQKEGQQRNQPIGALAQEILEQLPF